MLLCNPCNLYLLLSFSRFRFLAPVFPPFQLDFQILSGHVSVFLSRILRLQPNRYAFCIGCHGPESWYGAGLSYYRFRCLGASAAAITDPVRPAPGGLRAARVRPSLGSRPRGQLPRHVALGGRRRHTAGSGGRPIYHHPPGLHRCTGVSPGPLPWCQQSRAYLLQRLQRGRQVSIQPHNTDRYGRTVAEATSDLNVNLVMVEDGQAFAYWRHLRVCDTTEYLDAEFLACRHRYGVWQQEDGITRPWDFRRGRTAVVIPDGTTHGGRRFRCREIGSYALAQELLRQGHTYLDSNDDGEACESLR